MFTVLNSESLWIGTDLKRFNEIRDILDSQNIKYKYKVKDQLGEWTGSGTIPGTCGKCRKSSGASQAVRNTCRQVKIWSRHVLRFKMIRYFYKTQIS